MAALTRISGEIVYVQIVESARFRFRPYGERVLVIQSRQRVIFVSF